MNRQTVTKTTKRNVRVSVLTKEEFKTLILSKEATAIDIIAKEKTIYKYNILKILYGNECGKENYDKLTEQVFEGKLGWQHHITDDVTTTNGGKITESDITAPILHKKYIEKCTDNLKNLEGMYFIYYTIKETNE